MATVSSVQHLAALQYPWFAKRARRPKMYRASTPCSSSQTSSSRIPTPVDKENLRRQIVGLAVKRDTEGGPDSRRSDTSDSSAVVRKKYLKAQGPDLSNIRVAGGGSSNERETVTHKVPEYNQNHIGPKRTRIYAPGSKDAYGNKMPHVEPQEALRNAIRRSKTTLNIEMNRPKPKIVRFRMDEVTIGSHKAPIVSITDTFDVRQSNIDKTYEVRGNAIAVRKEGLKGLLAYKDVYTENDRKQNSIQNSLKIFRRRMKLNEEKFIQPNETTTEDYVIHPRSPFRDMQSPPAPILEERQTIRPLSSNDHVRILRSALHHKHNGGPVAKQTDTYENGETNKNIKCSYRLPENLNWGKEVSFKDMKDDAIPNVKTYVLEEDVATHVKFRKSNIENSVTLNTHNLNVHNSITQVNAQKIKIGDSEIDQRFVDWLEDSMLNSKSYKNNMSLGAEEPIDTSIPSAKRRISAKT